MSVVVYADYLITAGNNKEVIRGNTFMIARGLKGILLCQWKYTCSRYYFIKTKKCWKQSMQCKGLLLSKKSRIGLGNWSRIWRLIYLTISWLEFSYFVHACFCSLHALFLIRLRAIESGIESVKLFKTASMIRNLSYIYIYTVIVI